MNLGMCWKDTSYTRKLAEDVYKYEVGSLAVAEKKVRRFKDIPAQEILKVQQTLKGQRACPVGRDGQVRVQK